MQFKVPQDVQREDTIIGNITFKQLIIMAIGGGLTYSFYIILSKLYFWYIWIWPVAILGGLTIMMAFLKIHGMSFLVFSSYMIEYLFKPRNRYWHKKDMDFHHSVLSPIISGAKIEEKEIDFETELEKHKRLQELTNILDK